MEPLLKDYDHLRIPLEDIIRATNNFSDENFIGGGRFGKVFKGELSRTEGSITVAFRRLDRKSGQGDDEFWKEIMLLSRIRHENLVSLVGFCIESMEMILVHEYMTRGSLDRYLSDANLSWLNRIRICLDAARGLAYLHNPPGTGQRMIHGDLKSTNILLHVNWQAKIADFGLSRLDPGNQQNSFLFTNFVGTQGYVDSSYFEYGFLTKESDIYSFGVVLFEVLCGRLAYARSYGNRDEILIELVHQHYPNDTLEEMIDPILRKQMSPDSLKAFSIIAWTCIERDRVARPTAAEVVKYLEKILSLQLEFNKLSPLEQVEEIIYHLKIPLEKIKASTNNFSKEYLIGRSGFGYEYKGELSLYQWRSTVIINRFKRRYDQGNNEFLSGISMLSTYQHENLVSLVGYCDESDEKIVVFEHMENESLDKYIGRTRLKWMQLIQICVGVARGLKYLHQDVNPRRVLIHRNVSSSVILLDKNWEPKISGFWLSKLIPSSPFVVTNNVGGASLGYLDPGYIFLWDYIVRNLYVVEWHLKSVKEKHTVFLAHLP